ncbi:hypothetical protein NDU88_000421 [Pleurodeles waltl]|uniref:Uncharacterized protein n=1 Tax=Pleurodeles waltl TaxID=8319 RepID=A0AAV7P0U1_PLEWA|nr:hypothetical protein NDU88_000421 [Pleurodeles waltl]
MFYLRCFQYKRDSITKPSWRPSFVGTKKKEHRDSTVSKGQSKLEKRCFRLVHEDNINQDSDFIDDYTDFVCELDYEIISKDRWREEMKEEPILQKVIDLISYNWKCKHQDGEQCKC